MKCKNKGCDREALTDDNGTWRQCAECMESAPETDGCAAYGDVLTYGDAVAACRNIGYDLTCGHCAMVFYTGAAPNAEHDQSCASGKRAECARCDVLTEAVDAALHVSGNALNPLKTLVRPYIADAEAQATFDELIDRLFKADMELRNAATKAFRP